MTRKIYTISILIFIAICSFSTAAHATGSDPLAIESSGDPSDLFITNNRASISASTGLEATTASAPVRGLNRTSDLMSLSWGDNPFLPGGDGWDLSGTGNVGYPIGDASFPILISMLLFYFIYRGVSSTKRKNNF